MSKIDTSRAGWLADELKKAINAAPCIEDKVFRHYAISRAIERNDGGKELRQLIQCVADGRLFRPSQQGGAK